MSMQRTEVVIVGGGQAGLALSYYLTAQGRSHVLLEQGRIAESWRSRRWDSLCLIAPNWSLELPGFTYPGDDPEGYMGKDEVAAHLETYARSFGAPVREGAHVTAVESDPAGAGFLVRIADETYTAAQVVIATGALQRPRVPAWAADLPGSITQVVPYDYRNPQQLPLGAVLVVGSGQTGCQIAEDLVCAGRSVLLAMSRSWWLPRRYRGRDASAWLRALGWMQRTVDDLPPGVRTGQTNPQLTGGNGGMTSMRTPWLVRGPAARPAAGHPGWESGLRGGPRHHHRVGRRASAHVPASERRPHPPACPGGARRGVASRS